MRYLNEDEARRLANACQADFRLLVTGALLSGARYGELAAMTVDDFNRDAGTVRVRVSKSGKARHIVLTQEGRDFLATFSCRAAGQRDAVPAIDLASVTVPWSEIEHKLRPHSNIWSEISNAIGWRALLKWREEGVPKLAANNLMYMLSELSSEQLRALGQ